jgi:ABC-type glycerol-3-phosphate transport system substrate-binding protein
MKYLFVMMSVLLVGASALTFYSFSDQQSEKTVLHWIAAINPAREEQAKLFEKWMEDNGYPPVELRIEGPKIAKKNIVQGVAGVAGDIFDCYQGEVIRFQSNRYRHLCFMHGFCEYPYKHKTMCTLQIYLAYL